MNFIIKNLTYFNPISTLFRPYFDPRGPGADHFDFGGLISVSCIVRRQLKINNQISWNTITYLLKKYNINLELIKVKAHSDNWGNNEADRVANKGLYDDYWIINDHLVTSKYNIA